jgi:hypothetical protein
MGEAHRWSNLFFEIVTDIWHKYGPFAALLILTVMGYEYLMWKLWTARIKDKDREIDRLVQARNRIENEVLKNRRSSKGKNDDA